MAPNSVTISTDKANDFTLLQVHDLDSPIFQEKQKKSAIQNFVPAITFLMAVILRIEQVRPNRKMDWPKWQEQYFV